MLMFHQLVPEGHGFRLETNDDKENPHGKTTESVHHMFCNLSDVPTTVLLGTHWNTGLVEFPVKF